MGGMGGVYVGGGWEVGGRYVGGVWEGWEVYVGGVRLHDLMASLMHYVEGV